MHIQNFIKIHPFVLKILRKNTFLHQSRAITLLFINEFSPFAIPNHSSLISMSMRSLKKIGQKLLKLESGNNIFISQSRAITLLFINKFSPFAIPNHSSPISMSKQSLKKICQKLFMWRGIKIKMRLMGTEKKSVNVKRLTASSGDNIEAQNI